MLVVHVYNGNYCEKVEAILVLAFVRHACTCICLSGVISMSSNTEAHIDRHTRTYIYTSQAQTYTRKQMFGHAMMTEINQQSQ